MTNLEKRVAQLEDKLGMKQERSILVIRCADPDEEPIILAYGFSKEEREELEAKYKAKYAAERAARRKKRELGRRKLPNPQITNLTPNKKTCMNENLQTAATSLLSQKAASEG